MRLRARGIVPQFCGHNASILSNTLYTPWTVPAFFTGSNNVAFSGPYVPRDDKRKRTGGILSFDL